MKENREYNIGIDIGTGSVGWAVTDEKSRLLKFKKKNMWGVRLFEQAVPAVDRRVSRGTRRRYNKRRERIYWLNEFFMDEVLKVDSNFKTRLQYLSFLDSEDKSKHLNHTVKDNLFVGEYDDKKYFKKFPTVYHLRHHLCTHTSKADPRLVYLALHHIIKYRGNFLYEGQEFEANNSPISQKIEELFDEIETLFDIHIALSPDEVKQLSDILVQNEAAKSRLDKIFNLFWVQKNKKIKLIFQTILGMSTSAKSLFEEEIMDEDGKEIKIHFSSKYEEDIPKLEKALDEKYEFIDRLHQIYSWIVLQGVLRNENSISKAMINKYKQHEDDLRILKDILKRYSYKQYKALFKSKEGNCYYNYINHPSKVKQENICKNIEKILSSFSCDEEEYLTCLEKAKKLELLPKQNSYENGAIPYQLHLQELKLILNNQMQYYPTLEANFDELCLLVSYRYPYYIGPLSKDNKFAWLTRKNEDRIAPWNVNDVIDVNKTAADFIYRMISHCTYFPNEYVLPKKSLYVAKYEVLNELNKIRVDEKLLPLSIKTRLLNEVFMKYKVVKEEHLLNWFKKEQVFLNNEELQIKGYQKDKQFASSLAPWIDFTKIFNTIDKDNIDIIEKLIQWLTVYEDKGICKEKILLEYPNLSNKVEQILTIKCSGWSRLSKKLLVEIKSQSKSILDIMEETNFNFMEIINADKYEFKNAISGAITLEETGIINYDDIQNIAGSPAIKKGIWQSVLVIQEIIKVMKCQPKNIYVEFAREEGVKKRTISKVKRLQDMYQALKEDIDYYNARVEQELFAENNDAKLDNEKLFLYYLQQGKCMYSGEPLDISKLSLYQVDHIVPRCYIKDDSIDNKVLVKSELNQRKQGDLILKREIVDARKEWWKILLKYQLISSKKYYNLTRTEFNEKDFEGFINRQLVETRQITKHVVNLLKEAYQDIQVVAIKANLSHDFREKYNIYKIRELNDCHHAHDAYIASILGNYMLMRFPSLDKEIIYGQYKKYTNQKDKLLKKYSFILGSMDEMYLNKNTGEVFWNPDTDIPSILNAFGYRDYYISKKVEIQSGKMFKLTILPGIKHAKDTKIASVPVNKLRRDVLKYGGFSDVQYAYSLAIAYSVKNKWKTGLIGIPIHLSKLSDDKIKEYIKEKKNSDNLRILSSPIYKYQLIESDNSRYYISSFQEVANARQLLLNKEEMKLLHSIAHARKTKSIATIDESDLLQVYDLLCSKLEKYYECFKNECTNLIKHREDFVKLTSEQKVTVLYEIIAMMQANATNANLKLLGMSDRVGRKGGKTFDLKKTKFIYQSVTGMYSREVYYDMENSDHN